MTYFEPSHQTTMPLLFRTPHYAERRAGKAISWRYVLQRSVVPTLILVLRVAPPPINNIAYPLLAVYSLFGRRQAVLSLFLLCILNTLTHAFSTPPALAGIFRHFNIIAAAFSVFAVHIGRQPRSMAPQLLWWTAGLTIALIGHSVIASTMPLISTLKAISFGLTIQTLLAGWSSLPDRDRRLCEQQVFWVLAGVCFLSFPLIGSSAGYLKGGAYFQGLFSHSQVLGPAMAYLATWASWVWLTTRRHGRPIILILVVATLEIYLSASRIALLILLVGLTTPFITAPIASAMKYRGHRILKERFRAATVATAVIAVGFAPQLFEELRAFLLKSHKTESVSIAILESREFMIDRMFLNIAQHPVQGIGFGVPSDMSFDDNQWGYSESSLLLLPVMAATEKGNTPVAMVEEMGYPLALAYGLWFFALLGIAIGTGPIEGGICAAALATGLAEASLFSPGGAGLLPLVLITMTATSRHNASSIDSLGWLTSSAFTFRQYHWQ